MEDRHHLLLQHRPEVDEHVAAADEVEPRERRVLRQVLAREHAHFADRLRDLVAAIHLDEEPPEPIGADLGQTAFGVESRPRLLDRRVADVGAEYLNRVGAAPIAEVLEQHDGHRVDLLAGRASGNPDADRLAPGLVCQHLHQVFVLERLERIRLAEEPGDVDEDVLVERLQFRRISLEVLEVLLEALQFAQDHAAEDPPLDRRVLVEGEVHAARVLEQAKDLVQLRVVFEGRLDGGLRVHRGAEIRMPADSREFPGDRVRRHDEVDAACRDGAARHAVVLRRGRVLREGDAARGLDGLEPHGAVRRRPGEDDPDRAAAGILGQGPQELVDRHVQRPRRPSRREVQPRALDAHRRVRRDHVDMVRLHRNAIGDLGHRHGRELGQEPGQHALVLGVEVLHEDEGEAGVTRERGQELAERLEPAGRRADADDGARNAGRGSGLGGQSRPGRLRLGLASRGASRR